MIGIELKLLLVEDSESDADLLLRFLKKEQITDLENTDKTNNKSNNFTSQTDQISFETSPINIHSDNIINENKYLKKFLMEFY